MSIILGNEEDCSWHMLRCVHMFHNKCIQTWKASCKSEPDYGVCPQCRKPFRKLLCLTISRGGRSHATILRPSSSHDLVSILVSLELPVSIYFQTILLFHVWGFHPNPPHLFTNYLTHGSPFGLIQCSVSNFLRKKSLSNSFGTIPTKNGNRL